MLNAALCCALPVQRSGFNRLYPQYRFYFDGREEQVMMVAQKCSKNRTSNYHVFDMKRGGFGSVSDFSAKRSAIGVTRPGEGKWTKSHNSRKHLGLRDATNTCSTTGMLVSMVVPQPTCMAGSHLAKSALYDRSTDRGQF